MACRRAKNRVDHPSWDSLRCTANGCPLRKADQVHKEQLMGTIINLQAIVSQSLVIPDWSTKLPSSYDYRGSGIETIYFALSNPV